MNFRHKLIFFYLFLLLSCIDETEVSDRCEPDDDVIYTIVEQQPAFVCNSTYPECSWNELNRFIFENLVYPHEARINKVKGSVYVQFVIEKSGCIRDRKILRGLGYGCDEEALRIVGRMPPWNPGKMNGLPQRVRFVLPIRFNL